VSAENLERDINQCRAPRLWVVKGCKRRRHHCPERDVRIPVLSHQLAVVALSFQSGSADHRFNAVDLARTDRKQDARLPWGVLIDGRTRVVHPLSDENQFVTQGEDDTLTIDGMSPNPQSDASVPKPLLVAPTSRPAQPAG
jgi:hypothetical protein